MSREKSRLAVTRARTTSRLLDIPESPASPVSVHGRRSAKPRRPKRRRPRPLPEASGFSSLRDSGREFRSTECSEQQLLASGPPELPNAFH